MNTGIKQETWQEPEAACVLHIAQNLRCGSPVNVREMVQDTLAL